MANISGTHICIYIIGIIMALFIIGLSSKQINNNNNKDDNPFIVENLEIPNVSSSENVSGGASSLYGWGYEEINKNSTKYERPMTKRTCGSCKSIYNDYVDINVFTKKEGCSGCDITKHPDINKYVLKSSIPPFPDMSQFVNKKDLPPIMYNPEEWVRKNTIPPCEKINRDIWIKKSEVAPCIQNAKRDCPKCPICPIAPKCPPPPCGCGTKVKEKVIIPDDSPLYDKIKGQNKGPFYGPEPRVPYDKIPRVPVGFSF